jgi:2-hydroxychromene-2-carboxylate isomerase
MILYFDLGSPYAYLAVERAPSVLGGEPRLVPVLLGGIFRKRGFGSWSQTGVRESRVTELAARAERYGLPPLRWPAAWPADGLKAMRCATWASSRGGVSEFARALYRLQFAEGADIADEEVLAAAGRAAGLDAGDMLAAADQPHVKDELRAATELAWERGVRGVPSLLVGDTLFYGDDQLELAAVTG